MGNSIPENLATASCLEDTNRETSCKTELSSTNDKNKIHNNNINNNNSNDNNNNNNNINNNNNNNNDKTKKNKMKKLDYLKPLKETQLIQLKDSIESPKDKTI